jgi:DNA-binding transcriptional MocR family regulator
MPTAILLALAAAALYGASDFFGGLLSRRSHYALVGLVGQSAAAIGGLAAALAVSLRPGVGATGWGTGGAIGWGIGAGLGGAVGTLALYRGTASARAACATAPRCPPRAGSPPRSASPAASWSRPTTSFSPRGTSPARPAPTRGWPPYPGRPPPPRSARPYIDFGYGRIDPASFPREAWLRSLRRVLTDAPHSRLNYLPGCEPTGVAAGLHLVVWLPDGMGEDDVVAAAADHGVRVAGVGPYRLGGPGRQGLILGYGDLAEGRIAEGVEALAAAVAATGEAVTAP